MSEERCREHGSGARRPAGSGGARRAVRLLPPISPSIRSSSRPRQAAAPHGPACHALCGSRYTLHKAPAPGSRWFQNGANFLPTPPPPIPLAAAGRRLHCYLYHLAGSRLAISHVRISGHFIEHQNHTHSLPLSHAQLQRGAMATASKAANPRAHARLQHGSWYEITAYAAVTATPRQSSCGPAWAHWVADGLIWAAVGAKALRCLAAAGGRCLLDASACSGAPHCRPEAPHEALPKRAAKGWAQCNEEGEQPMASCLLESSRYNTTAPSGAEMPAAVVCCPKSAAS